MFLTNYFFFKLRFIYNFCFMKAKRLTVQTPVRNSKVFKALPVNRQFVNSEASRPAATQTHYRRHYLHPDHYKEEAEAKLFLSLSRVRRCQRTPRSRQDRRRFDLFKLRCELERGPKPTWNKRNELAGFIRSRSEAS